MIDYTEKEISKTHYPTYREKNYNKWLSNDMNFNKKD